MINVSYIIYNGFKDLVYKNPLVIHNNFLKYDGIKINGPIDALIDFGPLLVIRFGDHVYRFVKHTGEIFGGNDCKGFIYGIMYNNEYYRWFDTPRFGKMLYNCWYGIRVAVFKTSVTSFPTDSLTALLRYLRTINCEIDMSRVISGKDLLGHYNARGIKLCNEYSDVSIVCNTESE